MHCIQCQTSTDILEIMNEFVQYGQNYFQYVYIPIQPTQLMIKYKLKIMIRTQKIKGSFICGLLFFKCMGVFQSWLDSFSTRVWAFIQNRKFLC